MDKSTTRLRSLLDVVVTLLMGAVAVAVLWRMTTDASPRGRRGGARTLAPVEDLRASGLSMSLGGAPSMGSADAPVAMVGFTDFECPFCARFALEGFDRLQN